MIKSIRFKNFYSFRDTTIELHKSENILIGINGSGKSNFIKAIRFLKEGVSGIGLEKLIVDRWGGFDNIYFSGVHNNDDENFILEYRLDKDVIRNFGFNFTEDVFYQIKIHKMPGQINYYLSEKIYKLRDNGNSWTYLYCNNGKGNIFGRPDEVGKNDEQRFKQIKYDGLNSQELAIIQVSDPVRFYIQDTIKKAIKHIIVYDYFDTSPLSKIRKPSIPTSENILLSNGDNLPQILNTIKINYKQVFGKIVQKLNDVNGHYSDINFNFIGGNIELMLEEKGLDKSVHVSNISDGTLRFLCLLSIFFNPNRGKLVCIDEPEVGLHPDMILTITNAIQEFSNKTQFIIATHSENVLNAFDLEMIRVFEKNENNETVVEQYSEKDFEGWYEEYSTGKMWRQGDLGGNRW